MDHIKQTVSAEVDVHKPVIQEFLNCGQKAGNYRVSLKRVLLGSGDSDENFRTIRPFQSIIRARNVQRVEEIDKHDLAAYAELLADAVADAEDRSSTTDGISAATA